MINTEEYLLFERELHRLEKEYDKYSIDDIRLNLREDIILLKKAIYLLSIKHLQD
ncbi:hypothetical protein [Priestia megaterium]|uniref:hypothetical protein n=1 Tax=Priestia megaterium TaxID=1404 RepID=UPI0013EA9AA1|nr:hypothetical protein [Priestia megaterium]